MIRKPVIGISLSLFRTKDPARDNPPPWPAYARAVAAGGGCPMYIPTFLDPEQSAPLLDRVDGLVLSGGGDILPETYGAEKATELDEPDPQRDAFEFAILNRALDRQIPFLGICRGIQVMNVAMGGTLIQDIPSEFPESLPHGRSREVRHPHHAVRLHSGTMLREFLGESEFEVNSYHHQAVREVAPSLRVSGRAADEIIEAVEVKGFPFGVGVQWHPERMFQAESSQALFQALINAARGKHP